MVELQLPKLLTWVRFPSPAPDRPVSPSGRLGMAHIRRFRAALVVAAVIAAGACASLQRTEPLQVTVAGIEPMQGQGMELRMLVKLRVQNPNDAPVDFNG